MLACTSESFPFDSENIEKSPIIIDKEQNTGILFEREWLSTSYYRLYYIGPYQDSILVDRVLSAKFYHSVFDMEMEELPPAEFAQYDNNPKDLSKNSIPAEYVSLKIEVDTNQFIGGKMQSYAVFITNLSPDTAIISYRSRIPAIMEAKDRYKNWRPIQEPLIGCGFEIHSVKLPPSELVLTSAPVFNGDFKTELRIRIGENYSNSFYGSINPGQFESAFKANGDQK